MTLYFILVIKSYQSRSTLDRPNRQFFNANNYCVYLYSFLKGVLFPSNHAIWGQWAPPTERSRLFSITAAGCPVGTILTMPLTGLLTKYGFDGGWASVFYVFGEYNKVLKIY